MTISEDNDRLTIIIDKELKRKIQVLANIDKRSASNYVVSILEDHIKKYEQEIIETHGYENYDPVLESIFGEKVKSHLFSSYADFELHWRAHKNKLKIKDGNENV